MTACPICKHEMRPLNGIVIKGGYLITEKGSVHVRPITAKIVKALIRGPVGTEALAELVYSSEEDMPELPCENISVHICRLRPLLVGLGWQITTIRGLTHWCQYKLERINANS